MRYVTVNFFIFPYTMLIHCGILDFDEFDGICVSWLCLRNYRTTGSVSNIYVISDIKPEETLRRSYVFSKLSIDSILLCQLYLYHHCSQDSFKSFFIVIDKSHFTRNQNIFASEK